MPGTLKDLISRYAQPGRVVWIGLRPKRRCAVDSVDRALVTVRGIEGDHGASDKRAVTLLQAEHLAVIGAMLGRAPVSAADLRRNVLVEGINLSALKGRSIMIGSAVLEITGICAPCSRMEEALGPGGYSAMRGHGGWSARVVLPGEISVGDVVVPLTSDTARSL